MNRNRKGSKFGRLRTASRGLRDRTTSATGRVSARSRDLADASAAAVNAGLQGVSETVVDAASSVGDSAQEVDSQASGQALSTVGQVKSASVGAWRATTSVADGLLSVGQGLLASNLTADMNDLLENMAGESAAVYDRLTDAEFLADHVEERYRRLLDGQRTIAWTLSAVGMESPDDNLVREALGTVQGLFGDGASTVGLPFANWDDATFARVAGTLETNFHIPREWFEELGSYAAEELLGETVHVIALALEWNGGDVETFSEIAGSLGLSVVLDANPLLLVVTIVALARAFHEARETGDYAGFVDGQMRAGMASGATLAAVSVVGVAGGPAGAALLAGLATGILVNRATRKVSVAQIGLYMAEQATFAALETKKVAGQYLEVAMEANHQALAAPERGPGNSPQQ